MNRVIYDADILKYIPLFESLTGAHVRDCIVDDRITFVIQKGDMGLAIGKKGSNLHRVESTLKKQIRIIEFDENIERFIRNLVYPLRMFEISQEAKIVKIKGNDIKTKSLLIGRDRNNLKKIISIVKRYFDIKDILVV